MNLKIIGKVLTSKSVGPGHRLMKKRIYRAAVSQRLRNTVLGTMSNVLPGLLDLCKVNTYSNRAVAYSLLSEILINPLKYSYN